LTSIFLFIVALIVFSTGDIQAAPSNPSMPPLHAPLAGNVAAPASEVEPKQDACLHCHVGGENTNIWAPTARWTVFGTAGLIFVFGLVRSTSPLRSRTPWQPIRTRLTNWVDERYDLRQALRPILDKPVPMAARRWWYCLGGITLTLFLIQGVTGIMLAFYYKPTLESAYASIQYIETQLYFGAAVRSIHHWSANGMIIMCVAHMARVFIMGAYRKPREMNWVSGVFLLLMTLGFGLTGYLLPWDQRAYWATTVATEIGGSIPIIGDLVLVFTRVGWDVAGLTLSRFYALHVLILPLMTLVMMGAHFLMVRRQGIARPL
jgi:hypothetical protein